MSICIKDQIQNMNIVIGCTVGCTYCYARNNVKRWHMIDDFADPEFFSGKLKMMEKKRPQNFLLTGMSDLSGWKPEWRDEVFAKIRENPQHQFLFLTKRPDLLDFDTDLENAWFGVTVTRKAELWRIDALRKNVRAKHYHVTFEPLFDDPGTVDLSGINNAWFSKISLPVGYGFIGNGNAFLCQFISEILLEQAFLFSIC